VVIKVEKLLKPLCYKNANTVPKKKSLDDCSYSHGVFKGTGYLSWCARWNYCSCRQLYCPVARYGMLFLQNVKFVYYLPNCTRFMPLMRTEYGQMLRSPLIRFSLWWSPFQYVLRDIQTVSVVFRRMGGYGNIIWYKVLTLYQFNISVQMVTMPQAKELRGNLSKFWGAEHENGIKHWELALVS